MTVSNGGMASRVAGLERRADSQKEDIRVLTCDISQVLLQQADHTTAIGQLRSTQLEHSTAIAELRATQLEHSTAIAELRATQLEHTRILDEHTRVLDEHTRILGRQELMFELLFAHLGIPVPPKEITLPPEGLINN